MKPAPPVISAFLATLAQERIERFGRRLSASSICGSPGASAAGLEQRAPAPAARRARGRRRARARSAASATRGSFRTAASSCSDRRARRRGAPTPRGGRRRPTAGRGAFAAEKSPWSAKPGREPGRHEEQHRHERGGRHAELCPSRSERASPRRAAPIPSRRKNGDAAGRHRPDPVDGGVRQPVRGRRRTPPSRQGHARARARRCGSAAGRARTTSSSEPDDAELAERVQLDRVRPGRRLRAVAKLRGTPARSRASRSRRAGGPRTRPARRARSRSGTSRAAAGGCEVSAVGTLVLERRATGRRTSRSGRPVRRRPRCRRDGSHDARARPPRRERDRARVGRARAAGRRAA